jgi:hypothetical protein
LWKAALNTIELTNLSPTFLSTDLKIVQTVIFYSVILLVLEYLICRLKSSIRYVIAC